MFIGRIQTDLNTKKTEFTVQNVRKGLQQQQQHNQIQNVFVH